MLFNHTHLLLFIDSHLMLCLFIPSLLWIFSPFTGILICSVFFSSVRWCVCVTWKRLEIEAVNHLFSTAMFIDQSGGTCWVHAFSQNLLLGFSDWLFMSELWRWDCFELLGMFVPPECFSLFWYQKKTVCWLDLFIRIFEQFIVFCNAGRYWSSCFPQY